MAIFPDAESLVSLYKDPGERSIAAALAVRMIIASAQVLRTFGYLDNPDVEAEFRGAADKANRVSLRAYQDDPGNRNDPEGKLAWKVNPYDHIVSHSVMSMDAQNLLDELRRRSKR